ncbi:alpha/beta hydrolase [Sulfurovum sp. CS9]|uniref:alpha/beta hydrolase n=1 Tax=Sulfurovum sp. CS9 TaxID=3391146 RepID=UPI0039EB7932
MKNFLMAFIKLVLFVYITFGILLFINQRDILYAPTAKTNHVFDEVIFHNDKESISVIVVNDKKEKAILYFGGNGDTIARSAFAFDRFFPDHTVYLVNYRGYGGSSGEPSEKGIYSDALAIFDQIRSKHNDISVLGRSLGSGVSTYLASKREFEKLVLITPYDSAQSMVQERFPMYPMSILLKDKYDSVGRVKDIKSKTLILIAGDDNVILMKHTKQLIEAFPSLKVEVKIIEGVGHNTILRDDRYYHALQKFMQAHYSHTK